MNANDPSGLRCRGLGREIASFIPVLGSIMDTADDLLAGNYGWAAVNAGIAALDISGIGEATKIGSKLGSQSWKAVRPWFATEGVARPFQHVHHAFIPRNGWGAQIADDIKNQWWNMKPLEPAEGISMDRWHKMIEGKVPGMNRVERAWHGSPDWTKPVAGAALAKGGEFAFRRPCGCR